MQKSFIKSLVTAAATVLALALAPSLFGQGVTSASLTGFVTTKDGQPIAGAAVSVVHVPSGTKASTVSRPNGQYDVTGLRVGGPYTVTVTAKDLEPSTQNDIYVSIDQAKVADFTLVATGVVVLEKMSVSGGQEVGFDPGQLGTNTTFNRAEIAMVPTVRRDVQDLANVDTRIGLTINTSTGEFSVSAQGQNARFNSFLIDGQQANDPFGLNANGFTSLRSPVPLDSLAALTIELSPYDTTRSGFTGALINAVTRSGTNEFHGDVYTYYTGKSLRGENPGQSAIDPNKGKKDPLQEHTFGGSFGGPIIKDKLFFFLTYDEYKKTGLPSSPVVFQPDAATLQAIQTAAQNYGITPGDLASQVDTQQKSYLAKIDWNITADQRLSVTYRRTDSSAPNFSNSSSFTQLTSNAYQSNRINDNLSLLLNSTWTPDLRTEFGVSGSKYNGTSSLYTPLAPAVYINGVSGINLTNGQAVTGSIDLGTNISYQLNSLYTNDHNGHLYAEYSKGAHTFKFGADVDKAIYSDVFGQYYAGNYAFASLAAFVAGTPNYLRYQQSVNGGSDTVNAATYHYSYTDAGLLAQDTWKPNSDFTLTYGLRFDSPYFPNKPTYLPAFETAFGIPNNTVPSGNYTLAPRVGFNYKLPTKLPIQVRGGVGLFQGTNPAVWIGNAYGSNGLLNSVTLPTSSSSSSSTTAGPLPAPYTPFHPDPGFVQTLPTPAQPTPSISLTDPNFKVPTSWKGNIAVDVNLPWMGLVATAEGDFMKAEKAINYLNLNLNPTGTAPDGRITYAAAALHSNFAKGGVYELTNTGEGESQAYTLQLSRAMKNGWAFYAGYTHTWATEVQPLTSSVASSNYNSRTVINPNEAAPRRSLYLVPDKFVVSATREFDFFKGKYSKTRMSAIFRAQTGHAYSWVFSRTNDINGDGVFGNDAFYVPAGPNDPKVVWADTTGAQATAFWNFINTSNLKKYEGQIVPPNNEYSPWQHTLDVHLEQDIPLHGNLRMKLFADCLNFANLFDKSWGITEGIDFATGPNNGYSRGVATASINGSGQYVYTFNSSTLTTLTRFTDLSRWQVQIGARLEF